MNKRKSLIGILAGLTAGAALGLLFAPKRGKETREALAQNSSDYLKKINDTTEQMRSSVEDKLDQILEADSSEADEKVKQRIQEAKDEIKKIERN